MNLEAYKGVFVFAQQVDNVIGGIAFELIGKGKDLAKDLNTEVTAVLVGSDVKGLADKLAEYGADKVIVVDDPELKEYRTEPYTHALASVIEKYKPEIFLIGATAIGRDLGPRVCARIHTGLTADCTQLDIGDFPINPIPGKETKHNQLLMTRPAFGGNTIATIACPEFRPQMATVRPGVMKKAPKVKGAKAVIEEFNPGFTPNSQYVEILDIVKAVTDTVDIMDAKILVSGGRGMGGPDNFKILEELAEAIGGTVSCSRAVVDAGWKPKDLQVGQTGKTVRPNVYFAIGISGAIQHLAGMEAVSYTHLDVYKRQILTNIMSNIATGTMMFPIVIALANGMGVNPTTFVIAVVIACQCAFATPVGTPCVTQTMVGGYKFMDYVKIGLPLNIITTVAAVFLIPLCYGI